MYLPATNTLGFSTNGTNRMTLDASGNLGLGVTPSAWSVVTGLQVLNASITSTGGNTNNSNFGSNFYYDGTNFRYIGTNFATNLKQFNGGFEFYNAPSGTAGNVISFSQAMTLFSTGNLAVGGTSDNGSRLNVTGAATFSSSVTANSLSLTTPLSVANGGTGQTTLAAAGIVTGTGTTNYIPKFTSLSAIGNSVIHESADGNIGIGNNNNTYKLDVTGTMRIVTPNRSFFVTSNSYSISDGTLSSGIGMDGAGLYLGNVTSSTGWTITNPQLTLDASGNLGLGVTPSAWDITPALQVTLASIYNQGNDGTYITSNGYYNTGWRYIGSSTATQYQMLSGQHRWYNAPSGTAGNAISFTQAMTLDASGNLALGGTGTKVTGLSGGGSGFTVQANTAPTIGVWDDSDLSYYLNLSQIEANSYLWNIANGFLSFGTVNTERMRITSGGNVGIGTAEPSFKLTVQGSGEEILSVTDGADRIGMGIYLGGAIIGSQTAGKPLYLEAANSIRMTILSDGSVGIGTTSPQSGYRLHVVDSVYVGGNVSASAYTTRSDYDLKDEIQNIDYGINEVMQMQPVKYTYKSNGSTQLGFIAQDLGVITPEVVSFEDKMSVYYNALIPILTKAIQEQQALIKALEQRILTLENK